MKNYIERKTKIKKKERVILVGVSNTRLTREEKSKYLKEIELLAKTAGAEVVSKVVQLKKKPDPAYYIGKGKAEEIKKAADEIKATSIVVDFNLSPAQIRNLEKTIGLKVVDRTELILDIFALHAKTKQAQIQVELAQLNYLMPRLKRMWTHLSREVAAGGPGIGLRGPGEKQIEIDRRLANKKIKQLKAQLKILESRRKIQVKKRSENITVSLVGYTNAGKSTLLNQLSGENVLTEDKLFSTLDTKTALWIMKNKQKLLISDTVGFIKDIPHALISSFYATLEEVRTADILLHIVDASDKNAEDNINAVHEVLDEIGCSNTKTFLVFNKIDMINDPLEYLILKNKIDDFTEISALNAEGLDILENKIVQYVQTEFKSARNLSIPYENGKAIAFVEENAIIRNKVNNETDVSYEINIGPRDNYLLNKLLNNLGRN